MSILLIIPIFFITENIRMKRILNLIELYYNKNKIKTIPKANTSIIVKLIILYLRKKVGKKGKGI